jgi:hypothetical protein
VVGVDLLGMKNIVGWWLKSQMNKVLALSMQQYVYLFYRACIQQPLSMHTESC